MGGDNLPLFSTLVSLAPMFHRVLFFVGLTAALTAGPACAQTIEPPEALPGESAAADQPVVLEGPKDLPPPTSLYEFLGYRWSTSSIDWIIGSDDRFGMVSLASDHYTNAGLQRGLGIDLGFHFLDGPVQTDMPPRLFDFGLGYQWRGQLGPLRFDLATSVVASSDFEGSARRGIRFPSHAVGFYSLNPALDLVFGIDYLDRGDIKLLPVGGVILIPRPELRFELVFPRPRAVLRLTDFDRLYLAGELGGGTWAIERVDGSDDLATYRDLRLALGVEHTDKDRSRSALEIAYLFGRRLEYASDIGNMPLDDAIMLRLVTSY